MKYDTLRKSAFSHRFTTAASVLMVLLTVAAAGVVTANPVEIEQGDYRIDYSMNRTDAGLLDIRTRVVDTKTGDVVGQPTVTATPGEEAVMQIKRGDREWMIYVRPSSDGSGTLTLVVTKDGREIQNTVTDFPAPGVAATRKYTGAPLSLNLSKADIRDVLRTFGQITGLEITVASNVTGTVNVNIVNMPWDQALEQILRENGLSWRLEGNKMEVYKP